MPRCEWKSVQVSEEAADSGERLMTTHFQLDAVAVCALAFGREGCDGFELGLSSESLADSAHTDRGSPRFPSYRGGDDEVKRGP